MCSIREHSKIKSDELLANIEQYNQALQVAEEHQAAVTQWLHTLDEINNIARRIGQCETDSDSALLIQNLNKWTEKFHHIRDTLTQTQFS